MLITRWQAALPPNPSQIQMILESEGLEVHEEVISNAIKQVEKKHPFCEVRFVAEGELFLNVAGTQLLLRAGDRVEIPANTKHYYSNPKNSALTLYAHHPY